jgi:hypothetical protein
MNMRFRSVGGALAATAAIAAVAVVTAPSAGAIEAGIRKPTLTVVCTQPHHGPYFSAARFRQRGHWAAGGSVIVTLASGSTARPRAVLHTTTDAGGDFRLRRTLVSKDAGPWIAGATYTWTTAIYGDTWATARRGTVTLTGSC